MGSFCVLHGVAKIKCPIKEMNLDVVSIYEDTPAISGVYSFVQFPTE